MACAPHRIFHDAESGEDSTRGRSGLLTKGVSSIWRLRAVTGASRISRSRSLGAKSPKHLEKTSENLHSSDLPDCNQFARWPLPKKRRSIPFPFANSLGVYATHEIVSCRVYQYSFRLTCRPDKLTVVTLFPPIDALACFAGRMPRPRSGRRLE